MPSTYRVGQVDVAAAGKPVFVVIKPAAANAAECASGVLDRMASRGPLYRVGLVPSVTSRTWEFSDEPGAWCRRSLDISEQHTMQAILDRVAGQELAAPISVSQAGEYLCMGWDHGIGDSNLVFEVCAALTQGDPEKDFFEPLSAPTMAHPLPSAVLGIAKESPRLFIRHAAGMRRPAWSFLWKVLSALGYPGRLMRSRLAGERDADERYVAVWSQSDAGYIPALRRYRDCHHPGASPTAILMLALCRAFGECGVALHDELEVVVDLRRFLPRDEFTLANFFGVAKIAIGSTSTLEEFSTALRTTAGSLGTLLTLACFAPIAWLRMLFAPRGRKTRRRSKRLPEATPSILTISDSLKAPPLAKIAWARDEDAEIAIASTPGTHSHISIFMCATPNGAVNLTATFYPSHIDKATVARALGLALASAMPEDSPGDAAEPSKPDVGHATASGFAG